MKSIQLKILRTVQVALILSLGISCSHGIKFNPDAHRANHKIQAIVSEKYEVVKCFEPKFSEFACMHMDKWMELLAILKSSQGLSIEEKNIILKSLETLPQKEVLLAPLN